MRRLDTRRKARLTVYEPDTIVMAANKTTGEIFEGPFHRVVNHITIGLMCGNTWKIKTREGPS